VTDWPKHADDKVPSEISYSPSQGFGLQWGYDISPGSCKLVWTKLELDQQRRSDELRMLLDALIGMGNLDVRKIEQASGLPPYPGKDPVELVGDYLSSVREHLMHLLVNTYGADYLSTVPIDLVVTVPAVCQSVHQILGP
jgi:hypothetical protein